MRYDIAEKYSNYGNNEMKECNKPGPFTSVPVLNGGGCRNQTNNRPRQLTFCVSDWFYLHRYCSIFFYTKKEKMIQ